MSIITERFVFNLKKKILNIGNSGPQLDYTVEHHNIEYITEFCNKYNIKTLKIYLAKFDLKLITNCKTLRLLEFGSLFNDIIAYLPTNIEKVIITNEKYSHKLDTLPEGLKCLEVDSDFTDIDNPFDNLPAKLESLIIGGDRFNHKIDNLPINLKHLVISGEMFNQPLENLPYGLIILDISFVFSKFNQKLDNLPKTLEFLQICGEYFKQDLINLPDSLNEIDINKKCYESVKDKYTPDKYLINEMLKSIIIKKKSNCYCNYRKIIDDIVFNRQFYNVY